MALLKGPKQQVQREPETTENEEKPKATETQHKNETQHKKTDQKVFSYADAAKGKYRHTVESGPPKEGKLIFVWLRKRKIFVVL